MSIEGRRQLDEDGADLDGQVFPGRGRIEHRLLDEERPQLVDELIELLHARLEQFQHARHP